MCSHCLFPACWQVATSLQQTCYKLNELNSLVTSCSNNLLSGCKSTTCQQVVSHKLGTTWQNNSIATNLLTRLLQACCEHNLLTSCAFFACVFWNCFFFVFVSLDRSSTWHLQTNNPPRRCPRQGNERNSHQINIWVFTFFISLNINFCISF